MQFYHEDDILELLNNYLNFNNSYLLINGVDAFWVPTFTYDLLIESTGFDLLFFLFPFYPDLTFSTLDYFDFSSFTCYN